MRKPQMPDPRPDDILDPKLRPTERRELMETARLLEEQRPVPRPAFRGKLARQLRADPGSNYRVRRLIAAYAGSGAVMLLVVAIGLAGFGPLASG
jgi:hypothetical protein